ncbi:MAG: 2-oxoacid ferredoxin oxidoreductase, partial [Spirochaetota bacterium]
NTYYLEDTHDTTDRLQAVQFALQSGPYPLGILYQKSGGRTYESQYSPYAGGRTAPLYTRERSMTEIDRLQSE